VAAEAVGYGGITTTIGYLASGAHRSINVTSVLIGVVAMTAAGVTANCSDDHADRESGRKTLALIFGARQLVHGSLIVIFVMTLLGGAVNSEMSFAAATLLLAFSVLRSLLVEIGSDLRWVHATSVLVECIAAWTLIF
jgi:1,4-dihydroxy-2-naphthoate octaprenyltransferase